MPTWYVRVKGKVLGPFDADKLRSLRDRGQFRRVHEISVDKRAWAPASTLTELFPAPAATDDRREPARVAEQDSFEPFAAAFTPEPQAILPEPAEWYYLVDGVRHGPETESVLRSMLLSGEIDRKVSVWRADLPQWMSAVDAGLSHQAGRRGGAAGTPLVQLFLDPTGKLADVCHRLGPGLAGMGGAIAAIVACVFSALCVLILDNMARNHPQAFWPAGQSIGLTLPMLAFILATNAMSLLSLAGAMTLIRLIARGEGGFGYDIFTSGLLQLLASALLPFAAVIGFINPEVLVYAVLFVLCLIVVICYTHFVEVARLPTQGAIFAVPGAIIGAGWLSTVLIRLLVQNLHFVS